MLAIVDYGMGNLKSIANALDLYGNDFEIITEPANPNAYDRLILPGVGNYRQCSINLETTGFKNFIKSFARSGKPVLGICLGMQILSSKGYENGENEGLNLISGKVQELEVIPKGYRVPHVGWNNVHLKGDTHPLFKGVKPKSDFYFTHSYHFVPEDDSHILTTTEYGIEFVSAVINGNVVGTQFHPEKSQDNGLTFLNNFVQWQA